MQQSRERKIDAFTCSAVNASGALLNCALLNLLADETNKNDTQAVRDVASRAGQISSP
jgi:hypothetical protein